MYITPLLLLALLAILTPINPILMPLTPTNRPFRHNLSHSKSVLNYYKNLQKHALRRHDLSATDLPMSYQQLPLETNHFGFTLDLKIAGLPYKLSMDTGSSDFFIKGEAAPGSPSRRYKSNSRYTNLPTIKIGYLDGTLRTYATTLNVEFNGYTFNSSLLVAYTAPAQFLDVEGLIGLSFPELARHKPTFIQTLIAQKIISKDAFGMNLNLIQASRSFISFGDPDPLLFEGDLKEYSIKKSQ
jgi:hypothetical protein